MNSLNLYHYKPLQTIEDIRYLKSYLENNIWLTPLENFNDPFDGCCKLSSSSNEPLINPFLKWGAMCFANSPTNIPMWAYYGKNHTGYCLIFEIDFKWIKKHLSEKYQHINFTQLLSEFLTSKTPLMFHTSDHEFALVKINYQKLPPLLIAANIEKLKHKADKKEHLILNSVGIKCEQWAHEQEYRLISNANSINSGPINLQIYTPFLKLTGIILGKDMPTIAQEILCTLCEKHKIATLNSYCSDSNYDLKTIEIKN